jgi:hypothetical protein
MGEWAQIWITVGSLPLTAFVFSWMIKWGWARENLPPEIHVAAANSVATASMMVSALTDHTRSPSPPEAYRFAAGAWATVTAVMMAIFAVRMLLKLIRKAVSKGRHRGQLSKWIS